MKNRTVTVEVSESLRRVLVRLPVTAFDLSPDGWLMALAFRICGEDAVCDALVGSHLQGFAFCAKNETRSWRDELGITPPRIDNEHA